MPLHASNSVSNKTPRHQDTKTQDTTNNQQPTPPKKTKKQHITTATATATTTIQSKDAPFFLSQRCACAAKSFHHPLRLQQSRPMSTGHNIAMEHRLRRNIFLLNSDTDADKEMKKKFKRNNNKKQKKKKEEQQRKREEQNRKEKEQQGKNESGSHHFDPPVH